MRDDEPIYLRIKEIEDRCDDATPHKRQCMEDFGSPLDPDWFATHERIGQVGGSEVWNSDGDGIAIVYGHLAYGGDSKMNAEFIAHARTDIPFLIALVKQQDRALERLAATAHADAGEDAVFQSPRLYKLMAMDDKFCSTMPWACHKCGSDTRFCNHE